MYGLIWSYLQNDLISFHKQKHKDKLTSTCSYDLCYVMTYINIDKGTHIQWICSFTHSQ